MAAFLGVRLVLRKVYPTKGKGEKDSTALPTFLSATNLHLSHILLKRDPTTVLVHLL